MSLWTASEAAKITGGKTGNWSADGVSIDTRTLKQGDLFIALKGPNVDGHDYAGQALKKGAAAVMVEHMPQGASPELCLVVDDTMEALKKLGQASRARSHAKIIAVTGSVGKTGTKDMLEAVFSAQAKTHASQKSFNNHWGVPLTLALMPRDTEVGIFEIGMNHAGEISPLVKMVKPDIAIITTVEAVHIEHFEDGEQGVAKAKAEIFEGFQKNGKAFLNKNNKWFNYLVEIAEKNRAIVSSFGEGNNADARLSNLDISSDETSFRALIAGKKIDVTLSVSGKHHALNSLPVLLAVNALGYDLEQAAQSLEDWKQRDGRGKQEQIIIQKDGPPVILLDEHYNASPVAMRAAFEAMGRIPGRKIAVLGDMAELGKNVTTYHTELAEDLLKAKVDLLFAAGPDMGLLYNKLPIDKRGAKAEFPSDLIEPLEKEIRPGDVILIKGSRGGAEKPKMLCLVDAVKALAHK